MYFRGAQSGITKLPVTLKYILTQIYWLQKYNSIKLYICSHILLCNVLTTILKPNFEDPLDTSKQLVQKNITIFVPPGGQVWKQYLLDSSIPEYNLLGDKVIIADGWDQTINMSKYDVIGEGTHATLATGLTPTFLDLGKGTRGWYRSEEKLSGAYPFSGFLTNKRWHLNKVTAFLIKLKGQKLT